MVVPHDDHPEDRSRNADSEHEASPSKAHGAFMDTKRARLAVIGKLCLARPHVIIIPLVVCAVAMGLGVWGVCYAADRSADNAMRIAQSNVEAAASALQLSIQATIMPVTLASGWIKRLGSYSSVAAGWEDRMSEWYAPIKNVSDSITLCPAGFIAKGYPTLQPGLKDKDTVAQARPEVFKSMETRQITVVVDDPVTRPDREPGTYMLHFMGPIFVKNVNKNETWGLPYNISKNVPESLWWDNTTNSKWWGLVVLNVYIAPFLSSSGPLHSIMEYYSYQIWRPKSYNVAERRIVTVTTDVSTKLQPDNAVMAIVPVANEEWELYVWKEDGWEPTYQAALIAVVVVGSLLLSLLLFTILISWAENQALLQVVLPKAAIKRMRHEMDWTTNHVFDGVQLVEIDTPAQQMLTVLQAFLEGGQPPLAMVVAVKQALQASADVYRPLNEAVQTRLREASFMDDEARLALARQLGQAWSQGGVGDDEGDERQTIGIGDVLVHSTDGRGSSISPAEILALMAGYSRSHTSKTMMSAVSSAGSTSPAQLLSADGFSSGPPGPFSPPSMSGTPRGTVANGVLGLPDSAEDDLAVVSHPPEGLVVEKPIVLQLDQVLASASNSWQFDAYALEEATQGHPLSVLGFWLMHTSGCIKQADINPGVLARFLRRVEAGYPKENPYHNARHAADVLQRMHMILRHGGLMPHYADANTQLACYLTAIIHDFEHRGLSTDFLTSSHDKLAVLYNDKSPMENHHLAAAWALMAQPQFNFLSGMSKDAWAKLRKLVIELVLGTDMKQHFSIMGQFTTQHSSGQEQPSATLTGSSGGHGHEVEAPHPVNESEKLLSLQMAVKCADLGHLTAPLAVHLRWVEALEEELFKQGDEERSKGLPISPLCDRNKEGVTKSQVGFFDFVCVPLFTHFSSHFQASQPLLAGLKRNYEHWKGQQAVVAMAVPDSGTTSVQTDDSPRKK